MKLSATWAAALACIICVSGAMAHADDDTLRPVLEERYADMKAAMKARDEAAIKAILAPWFTCVDISGGVMTGDEMAEAVSQQEKDPTEAGHTTILSIKHKGGDSAIVEQRYEMKTVKKNETGFIKHINMNVLSTDEWVKINGKWFLERTRANQMDYLVDGESVDHRVRKQ